MQPERAEFVDEQRRKLLYYLLSPWRRRGASLLQVGLRDGLWPDFFWEAGFDVTALDADPAAVEASREATGPKVEYALGQPDHMPFDDSQFDHVVIVHSGLEPRMVLGEALRVAARGIIALEWNRFSLAALSRGEARHGVWPWMLTWLGRKACPECRMSLYSVLRWPVFAWPGSRPRPESRPGPGQSGAKRPRRRLREPVTPLPFGAIMGLRMEIPPVLLTPIGALTEPPRSRAYAGQAVVNSVSRRTDPPTKV